jgi:hypothetical protein
MFLVAATGCLGDPPPDPEAAPLEVVLDTCTLNRSEVEAGIHNVAIVGPGQLVVTDEAGKEVLSLKTGNADLSTSTQTYTFTCITGSKRNTAKLQSN